MAMETTNPTSVGAPTKKSHYDDVFGNTTWIWSILDKYLTPSAKATLLDNRLLPGYVQRPQFSFASTNSITISPGVYELNDGTTSRMVYWDSDLTYTFSNLTTVTTWCYLYLDESAISTGLLTTSEFTDSTVKSTYIPARHGHYNGSDRCILAVRSNTAGEIQYFAHEGDYFQYSAGSSDISIAATIVSAWTTGTLKIPPFAQKAAVHWFAWFSGHEENGMIYRTAGSSVTAWGIRCVGLHSTSTQLGQDTNQLNMITNSSQEVEYMTDSTSTAANVAITGYTNGYYFPKGM